MSEHPPDYQTTQPTALDNLVHQRFTDLSVMKQVNWSVYESLLIETASMLSETEQQAQEALHRVCVAHNTKPGDVLVLIHDFLATFPALQQHEQAQPEPPTPEEASPFLGRGEP